ncbi:MAG: hypothetical protein P3X22_007080 [Thermoprotei archaeon]|nr:hypothetical protein [Thermoprotei archaeon]
MDVTSYIIGFAGFASAIFYLVSSISLLRLYYMLGGELWLRLSLGFAFLCLSQAAMVFSLTVWDARLSYALYSSAPALALSGFYMLWSSRRLPEARLAASPLVLAPALLDLLASAFALTLSRKLKGYARGGFSLIALAHALRALGVLAPPGPLPVIILVTAEIVRAFGALIMAAGYVRRLL